MSDDQISPTTAASASDGQLVADLAVRAAAPTDVGPDQIASVVVPDGGQWQVQALERYGSTPWAKRGTVVVHDVATFNALLGKHADADTLAVFTDGRANPPRITAVLDHHGDRHPGWGRHRIVLALRHAAEWTLWTGRDRVLHRQDEFAELIEDRLPDFADPDGATMLELAQSFHATKSSKLAATKRLKSGETTLAYVEEIGAAAGTKRDIAIPDTVRLVVRVFDLADAVLLDSRLRYRLSSDGVRLGLVLTRPDDVAENALQRIMERVTLPEGALPVLSGAAPDPVTPL